MGLSDMIKDAVAGNEDTVNQGIDKVADLVDEHTQGQYSGQVDQAQSFLKDQVSGLATTTDEQA